MNKLRIFIILLGFGMAFGQAYAKPAMKGIRIIEQPDGNILKVKVIGDEHLHFTVTESGDLLRKDPDGFYRLAKISADGVLSSTGILPYSPEAPSAAINLKDISPSDIQARRSAKRKAAQSGLGLCTTNYPSVGNPKGLIILVEFSDVKFKSTSTYSGKDYFNDMINGDNFTQFKGTGSAKKYFEEQSGGKFVPDFDVLGPVTLPQKMSYYGANDAYGDDIHPELMVTHAVEALDPTVNFSVYDTDHDGIIDNIYIFYAGQGEADYGSEDSIWPHSWDVRFAGINRKVDGVTIAQYACSNEWDQSSPSGVGTFIHEFSHVMGLPDLYHTTDANASYTPDEYSVLDYGPYNNDGRTPPNYGAYEKNALGWFEPIVLSGPETVSLEEISTGQFALIPTEKSNEFFLLENRQQAGWDKYIPNHGMLIWHIDYEKNVFDQNIVNNTKNHQYVDIVEANNRQDYRYSEGWTYPGTSGNTSFTSSTTPALKSWAGKAIDIPITGIKELGGIITFYVSGGGNALPAPKPTVIGYSESKGYFMVEWDPIEGAIDYFITVYAGIGSEEGEISTGFDNSALSEGWTASSKDWYNTNSNFGENTPSFKFNKDGQTLTSPKTDGNIRSLKFWSKGQSTENTVLNIEGFRDDSWIHITDYEPLPNKTETAEINDFPVGVRQIRFTLSKTKGNIAVDDIRISYGGGSEILEGYNNRSTEGKTMVKVDFIKEDGNEYSFVVSAYDGEQTSQSRPVNVIVKGEKETTGVVTGTENSDAIPEYFSLQGIRIANPTSGMIVIERKGSATRKIKF